MISINHGGRHDAEKTSSPPLSTGNPSSISLISFSRVFRFRNNPQTGRDRVQNGKRVIMTLMWFAIPRSDDRTFLFKERYSLRIDAEKLLRSSAYYLFISFMLTLFLY